MKIVRRLIIVLIMLFSISIIFTFQLTQDAVEKYPIHYNDLIEKYSQENGLDPFLVAAVIRVESNYHPDVTSHMNAHGLMQLLPETADWITKHNDENYDEERLMEPEYNIRLGTSYLKYLKDYFGETQLVLAAYNGGLSNVNQWLETPEYSKDGKHLDFIPFQETDQYVTKVSDYCEAYHHVYHDRFPNFEIDQENPLYFHSENYKAFLLSLGRVF